ncbi:hypothetical protein BGZ72_006396 [Mortierella alpina]|nr:hypothetical protein BGZ72_006396 [Mortierella alpina]
MHSLNTATLLFEDERPNHHIIDTYETLYKRSSSVFDASGSSREDLDHEEEFYDHYDIQLEPWQPRKSKTSKAKQRFETKIELPILRSPKKHYVIPLEVLDLVCSHLGQATLRYAVSRVCKDWNSTSKRYIQHTDVWENATTDQENLLLEQIPNLSTLECNFGTLPGCHNAYDRLLLTQSLSASWDRFRAVTTAPLSTSDREQHADNAEPKCLLHHIRRLVLKGPQMTYEVSIPTLLGQFQFLQSLELLVASTTIPLFELLDNSPSLRELKVVSQFYLLAEVISGDDEDLILEASDPAIYPAMTHSPTKPSVIIPPKVYPEQYKLQAFCLDHVGVKQRVLERLIATCPNLREFKLHQINENVWMPQLSLKRYCPIDEERLWNHMQNCCPKIDWYHISLLVSRDGADRIEALRRMRQSKTFGQFLTTTCTEKWLDHLQDLDVRRALLHVTVLEVLPKSGYYNKPEFLQQLLCLMPNLLHLIAANVYFAATDVLVIPGCARPEALRKEFIHTNRFGKRHRREEKRQQRQKALERFQVPKQDRLTAIPEAWQCRDLRTMAMDFSRSSDNFSVFTRYVEAHRLLRNLTSLSIGICELRVGQVKENPTAGLAPPERWNNDFLLLRGLRCLETLDVKTKSIVGVIQATDFEFLRRQDLPRVMLFIAAKNKDAGSDLDEDSAENKRHGRRKNRTFWPYLQSLHIRVQAATNFAHVVAGIEQIRPGVEFVIKEYSA